MPLLASLAVVLAASAAPPAEPTWLNDLEQAKQLARKTSKPIFVVFRCEH